MEAAADALAAMAADGAVGPPSAPPNFGGERFPGGGGLSPPFNASAQVEQDEALALALQQQLVWEDEEEELARARHTRLEQAAAYPGLGGPQFVGQRGARDRHSRPPADLDDSPGPLEGLGSAVYSAGAATLGAAGAAASSLWEWATKDGHEDEPAERRPGGAEPAQRELRAIHGPADEERHSGSCSGADHSESGQAGSMRRRARRGDAKDE
eukprot:CAMPEP_0202780830 /NCGR_PEP_ID=MMETSP1388-20130828/59460_1 /ASSEMBLY_ACC=CAM_ASM_000864 /TAXON_ID=37098 /ORGANISM="Isochrysis sp, Strain CCMP1244" /LENGTH=211 /DNA_ID=CAMNT_0049450217 /DNA_START=14 /DNA_END=649 /DNA_ORIENTATION=+